MKIEKKCLADPSRHRRRRRYRFWITEQRMGEESEKGSKEDKTKRHS